MGSNMVCIADYQKRFLEQVKSGRGLVVSFAPVRLGFFMGELARLKRKLVEQVNAS